MQVRNADAAQASRLENESKSLPDKRDLPTVYLVDL